MKRHISKIFAFAVLTAGFLLQAACSSSTGLPKVLASAPLSMDKAGVSTSIDFTVSEATVATKHRLMVALDFPQTKSMKLENAMQQEDMPVALEVVYVTDGNTTPIPTQDDKGVSTRTWKTGSGVANLHLYATNGDTSYVLIAGFYPTKPGSYRATVKTVKDQPLFSGVNGVVKVQPFYNTGE
ncbi:MULTISPECIES: hypothetical protein [unclassified Dyella]|uniref:hypothetical protein n=1 Tax=unclassified Dyella TaxID=2634549 RepID=UPI000C8456E8|nr:MULTISPECIES: hypothetical protein [unclassified Dyella]MDR3443612.1 hypothetical protein [Dyella sp.]